MKNHETIPGDLSDAINVFVKKLPDPDKSFDSTIKDEIFLNDHKITFMPQKRKGQKGMCWDIRYKATITDQLPD